MKFTTYRDVHLFSHFDSRGGSYLKFDTRPFDALEAYFQTFLGGEPETDEQYIRNLQQTVLSDYRGAYLVLAPEGTDLTKDVELDVDHGGNFRFYFVCTRANGDIEPDPLKILVLLPADLTDPDVDVITNNFDPDYSGPEGLIIEDVRRCMVAEGFVYLDNPRYRKTLELCREELGEDAFGVIVL